METPKAVLITGASSGIGEALALKYLDEGWTVGLLARRKNELERVQKECFRRRPHAQVFVFECDITQNAEVMAAVNEFARAAGQLDLLIANAGFGVAGKFMELKNSDYQRQFDVNIFGVMDSVRAAHPHLKASKGQVAIVGSVMSYVTVPGKSAYAMSKFAVRALSDALYHEFAEDGIAVSLICPGYVDTNIFAVNNKNEPIPELANTRRPIKIAVPKEEAAADIYKALTQRKREAVITKHGQLAVLAQRHLPDFLHKIMQFQKKRVQKLSKSGNPVAK